MTAPAEGSDKPYQAATQRFDRVKDGDRLPFDDMLVYEGPVGRFLDLAVWVAKADHRDRDLTDLLADEVTSEDVQKGLVTLAGLAVAAPAGGRRRGIRRRGRGRSSERAAGSSTRCRARASACTAPRCSPHERFGAGEDEDAAGRHPGEGVLRAEDMSFASRVIRRLRRRKERHERELRVDDMAGRAAAGHLGSVWAALNGEDVWR